MSNPNWADLTVLKSKMYLDLSSVDADRDAALELLGEHVTARIILSLNNSSIDDTEPPIPLNQACNTQTGRLVNFRCLNFLQKWSQYSKNTGKSYFLKQPKKKLGRTMKLPLFNRLKFNDNTFSMGLY